MTKPEQPEQGIQEEDEDYKPKLFDPERLEDYEGVIPDDYITFPNPFELGEICDIPIRMLDFGEALTFVFAIQDRCPKMPDNIMNKKRTDLNAEERKIFTETQAKIDEVMNEAYTEVTNSVILQPGWTDKTVAKLPFSTRMDGYIKAMRAVRGEASITAEMFPKKSN